MSLVSDAFAAIRRVVLIDARLDHVTADLAKLDNAHAETRERLLRVEIIIDEALRASAARRLPENR